MGRSVQIFKDFCSILSGKLSNCFVNIMKTFIVGGVFRIYLKFDEHYNHRPPKVCFHTIPFHPNSKLHHFA